MVTFDNDRDPSGFNPIASESIAAKSCAGMMYGIGESISLIFCGIFSDRVPSFKADIKCLRIRQFKRRSYGVRSARCRFPFVMCTARFNRMAQARKQKRRRVARTPKTPLFIFSPLRLRAIAEYL